MTLITEQWLKDNKFQQIKDFKHYVRHIPLPYTGVTEIVFKIDVSIYPHNLWKGAYEVNGIAASRILNHTEEVEALYNLLTGTKF